LVLDGEEFVFWLDSLHVLIFIHLHLLFHLQDPLLLLELLKFFLLGTQIELQLEMLFLDPLLEGEGVFQDGGVVLLLIVPLQ